MLTRNTLLQFATSLAAVGFTLVAPAIVSAAEGRLVEETVHFASLEDNLVDDPADRSVLVYLPPSYAEETTRRYPVVYLLHGGLATNRIWLGEGYLALNVKTIMDRLTTENEVREMLIVMPEANTIFGANFYVNTPVLGNHRDYIVQELVEYVDANYRTLSQPESRGIAGHSSGGYGAFWLGINHPGVFAAVYGHEFPIDFERMFTVGHPGAREIFLEGDWAAMEQANPFTRVVFTEAASFSPDLANPPFYSDWLWVQDGDNLVRDEEVWSRWLAFDPLTNLSLLADPLSQLRGLRFDAASQSPFDNATPMKEASGVLTELGILHEFEVFDGGHTDRAASRMEEAILPFFSSVLAFETESTAIESSTWGQVKLGE